MVKLKNSMKRIGALLLSLMLTVSVIPEGIYAEAGTELKLGKAENVGSLETDGYEWNRESFELKLKDADIKSVVIDSVKNHPITIFLEGNSNIESLELTSYVSQGTAGNLTIKGNGALNIVDYTNTGSSDYLLVDTGAEVIIENSFQQYMGKLEVKGTLTAKGAREWDSYSIYAKYVSIGTGGRINALGKTGIKIYNSLSEEVPAFEIAEGGALYAPSSESGLTVYTAATELTPDNVSNAIKLPDGYFNENSSYGIKIVTEDGYRNNYAAVICSGKMDPVLEAETVTGAGALTLGIGNVVTVGDATWQKGSSKSVVLISDAEFSWFENLIVDNSIVNTGDYDVEAGSTVITLKPEYLETLSEGEHIVRIMFTGGEGIAKVNVTHIHSGNAVETPATCTKEGVKTYYKCNICGKYFEDAEFKTEIKDIESWKSANVINKLSHTEEGPWYKNADVHYKKCSECGAKLSEEAHSYSEWKTDQEATEDAAGSKHRDCTVCGCRETKEIAKIPHSHKAELVETPSTCTVQGVQNYYTCVCGKIFEDAECIIEIKDLESWKQGHLLELKAHAEDGSWYKNADVHYKKCSECGTKLSEEAHSYSEWKTDQNATEDAAGSKHRDCTVCGYRETEEIAKLPHSHKAELIPGKEATTEHTGLKECYKCQSCNRYFEDAECRKEIKGDINKWRTIPKKAVAKTEKKTSAKQVVYEETEVTPLAESAKNTILKEDKKEVKTEDKKTNEDNEEKQKPESETEKENSMVPVVILIISAVCIAAVAGTLFFRKKHN